MIRANTLVILLLIFFSSFLSAQQAAFVFQSRGVPANPRQLISYTQADGSTIQVYMHGDAVVHWASTSDGYSLLPDGQGNMEYAIMNSKGDMVASGVDARNPSSRSANELTFLNGVLKDLHFSQAQVDAKVVNHQFFAGPKNGAKSFPSTGNRNLLMILANFSNTSTTYTQAQFNNFMNQANYNGTGSFKDYYYENSYGQLTITTTVTAWVTLSKTHDYYGPQSKWGEFAYDAVVAANSLVDYSLFDNDGDGTVEGIAIIHQGPGQEATGSTSDIWSHSWDLTSAGYSTAQRTFDGVKVSSYTIQPEVMNGSMAPIGVMCHEFGHNLGAPDFYDTDYSDNGDYEGTGDWDVMASGSYNGSPSGSKPAHHNAYTKVYYYGWASATLLSAAQTITLNNAAQNSNSFYRYNTNTTNEFFLIENRQKVGFDAYIPGHGMIIYHADGDYISSHESSNDINVGSHQGLYPMAANSSTSSGIMSSSSSYPISTGACPWPGTGNKTSFTDATTPNAKSWASANTAKPVINITENTTNKTVTFCFMSCSSVSTSTISGSPFCAGAAVSVPYTLSGTVNAGNVFTAELSDASGNFTSPVSIGTLTSTSSGTISATIPAGTAAGTGYKIRVNSSNPSMTGTANSTNLTVNATLSQPSTITGQANPCQGNSESYSVTNVAGTTYTWSFPSGWSQTSGGTTNSVTATAGANGGQITVTPSNSCGNGTARTLSVTIGTTPAISTHPLPATQCAGTSLTMSVAATGSSISYQWKKDGSNIGTATNSSYTINSLQASDAGSYVCMVYNGCATLNSNAAAVAVNPNTSIVTHPANSVLVSGQNATFSVTASGSNLGYQWKKNNVDLNNGGNISGATSATIQISNVTSADAAFYSCLVSGDCGSANTNYAQLSLNTTGVEESNILQGKVYPNPAIESLTVDLMTFDQGGVLQLMDGTGKIVYQTTLSEAALVNINVRSFSAGLYHVCYTTNSGIYRTPILVK